MAYVWDFRYIGEQENGHRFMYEPGGEECSMSWELIINPSAQPVSGTLRREYYTEKGFTSRYRFTVYTDKVEFWHNNPKGRKDPYIGIYDGSEKELPVPKGVFRAILEKRNQFEHAATIEVPVAEKSADQGIKTKRELLDAIDELGERDPLLAGAVKFAAEDLGLLKPEPDTRLITDDIKSVFKGLTVTILGAERMRKQYQKWGRELGCTLYHPDRKETESGRVNYYVNKSDVVIAIVPFIKHLGTALARRACETYKKLYIPLATNSGAQNVFLEAADRIRTWKSARNVLAN